MHPLCRHSPRRAPWCAAILAAVLIAAGSGTAARAEDSAFLLCDVLPDSPGPYGDGSAAGELFGIYAAEINPGVLVYPDDVYEPDASPGPDDLVIEEAHVKGDGWFDPYATDGPGS